jgi:hypothetical protein
MDAMYAPHVLKPFDFTHAGTFLRDGDFRREVLRAFVTLLRALRRRAGLIRYAILAM